MVETRTGEGPRAREQAVISLGPALEWNPQERIAVEATTLILSWDKKNSLLLLMVTSPLEQSKSHCSLNSRTVFPRQVRTPSPRFTGLSGRKSFQCTLCRQPAAHNAALIDVCLSYTLFSYFSLLLFLSDITSVWKKSLLKITGEKLLFKAAVLRQV